MNRVFLWTFLAFCGLSSTRSWAAEASRPSSAPPGSEILSWFKRLEAGLSSSLLGAAPRAGRDVAAVAAVRAAGQPAADLNTPAWIGGIHYERLAALKKERKDLAQAINLVLQGRLKEGRAALDAFEKAHPKSSLMKDAMEARRKLAALQAAASKKDDPPPAAATSSVAAKKAAQGAQSPVPHTEPEPAAKPVPSSPAAN